MEPGIDHDDATSAAGATVLGWISEALGRRLPAAAGDPLVGLIEDSGWLGNQSTLEIAAWADYPGERPEASWLPSRSTAEGWQALGRLQPELIVHGRP